MPVAARRILEEHDRLEDEKRTSREKASLIVQALVALFLVVALAFHWAEVGLIGLAVIVLATAFTGIIEEHRLGHAFEEALPFTALLVVFFAIVGVIHDQHLFQPVIDYVFTLDPSAQVPVFFMANGVLSAISDNVFVATVYVNEVYAALEAGAIIEEVDIVDLEEYLARTTADDITRVYENLLRGSRNHLRAFVSRLEALGVDRTPYVMSVADYESILESGTERGTGEGEARGSGSNANQRSAGWGRGSRGNGRGLGSAGWGGGGRG